MAASSSISAIPLPAPSHHMRAVHGTKRRRHISPEAGRALEILGHAIEYLTDEFMNSGGSFSARNSQVEAVQLLMGINRQIYFSCPEVPSLGERFRTLLCPHTV